MRDGKSDIRATRATREPEELLVIVDQIRLLPRAEPRLRFRAKIAIISLLGLMPSATATGAQRSRSNGSRRAAGAFFERWVGTVALALFIALVSFWSLAGLAVHAGPNDNLYFLKRAGEGLNLSLTWNSYKKAEKSVVFAERRLSELNSLVSKKEIKTDQVVCLAAECERYQQTANSLILENQKNSNMARLDTRIQELEEKKSNLKKILEPAAGARVCVSDASDALSLNGARSISGVTDSEGKFLFTFKNFRPGDAEPLQAAIELDGRTEIVPLVPARGQGVTLDGTYAVRLDPSGFMIQLNQDVEYQAFLSSGNFELARGKNLRITDAAGSSLINEVSSGAVIQTDSNGNCAFHVKKMRADKISRIEIEVFDGQWKSLGEVLRLGTLKTGGSGNPDVSMSNDINAGFDIQCDPELESLGAGPQKITLTVRDRSRKLTDYIE